MVLGYSNGCSLLNNLCWGTVNEMVLGCSNGLQCIRWYWGAVYQIDLGCSVSDRFGVQCIR